MDDDNIMKVALLSFKKDLSTEVFNKYLPDKTSEIILSDKWEIDESIKKYAIAHKMILTTILPAYKYRIMARIEQYLMICKYSDIVLIFTSKRGKAYIWNRFNHKNKKFKVISV